MSSNERQAELEEELLDCAFDGDFGRVRQLVQTHRVNVNCVNKDDGMTPLMCAAWFGHVHIARFLLENGADVHAADHDGNTALSHAVHKGNVAMAELLLEHNANIETRISPMLWESSLLSQAICRDFVEMVALLLRYGANTEETPSCGQTYTALHIACSCSSKVEIVQLLLDHDDGVDINAFVPRDHEHYNSPATSPLCKACRGNNMEMVQLLIQRGARVIYNGVYPDSPCPLVHAVGHETAALLWFLLDQTNLQEEMGNDNHPLSPALEKAVWWNKLEAAQLLVDHGANVNDRAFSLLWKCAKSGRCKAAHFLLRASAINVNLADPARGETPLWAAAQKGNAELVKEFLKARADVRICDNNNGETPLGVAYRQGHKGIVYLLLRTSPHVWSRLGLVWKTPSEE